MEELADKWQDLSDIQQASITELIAGKRQGNIVSSLMNNFNIAQDALETSLGSSGSAMREHEKASQSLEFKLNSLKAAWQAFALTFMDSDFLKGGVDALIKVVDILDKLIDNFGILGTAGIATAGFGIFKGIKGDAEVAKKTIADVVAGIDALTDVMTGAKNAASGIVDTAGDAAEATGNITKAAAEGAEAVSTSLDLLDDIDLDELDDPVELMKAWTPAAAESADALGNVTELAGEAAEGMTNAGKSAGKAAGGFKAFATSAGGIAIGIGVAIAAIALLYNQIKKHKEAISEARQETIKASDEFLEAAGSFEQAYIKYGGKTNLTIEEEAELEAAIQGTVNALDDKSGALHNIVNSSNDYVKSLERIKNAELEAAAAVAEDKQEKAELELKDIVKGWFAIDGSEVDIELGTADGTQKEAVKVLQEMDSEFVDYLTRRNGEVVKLTLSADADISEIVKYHDFLLEYQTALEEADLGDTTAYDKVAASIEKMSDSISTFIDGTYEAVKAQYQLKEGIPQTTEAYVAMREAILKDDEIKGLSIDTRKTIANTLDSDYAQIFDLSDTYVQARQLIGILDEFGDIEANETESFLNMQTAVNNNECSVGEYLAAFDDIQGMTKDWSKKSQDEFNTTFGLDTDTIKEQYEDMYKYMSRNYLDELDTSGLRLFEKNEYLSSEKERLEDWLKGLTASELSALVSIRAEIIPEISSGNFDGALQKIQDQVKLQEALNFETDIEVDTTALELLNEILAESASAMGLSEDSIDSLKAKYAELDSFDSATLFEKTASGIKVNRDELEKLEKEYNDLTKTKVQEHLDTLVEKYNEVTAEIDKCSNASERAQLLSERKTYKNQIEELAEYQAQLEGVTGAYQDWLNAQSTPEDYEGYENVATSREDIADEIDRGFISNATKKYIDLLSGEDLDGKDIDTYAEAWERLSEKIPDVGYSINDFFTVNDDGDITATGIDRFFKSVKENIEGIYNADTGIYDFSEDNINAIKEKYNMGIEAIQLMLEAAASAGYTVDWGGILDGLDLDASEFDTLVGYAEDANNAINKLAKTNADLKEAGFGDYEFDFEVTNIEDANTQLDKAKELLNNPAFQKDGKFNIKAEGAEEAKTIAETLLVLKQQMEAPVYMSVDTTELQSELQEPVKLLQSYEEKANELERLNLTPEINQEDIKQCNAELNKIAESLANLDHDQKVAIGINGMSVNQIREQLENGTIEIPAELTIEANMDKSLEDLVTLGLLEQGLITEAEAKVKLGLEVEEVDDSDVKKTANEVVADNQIEFPITPTIDKIEGEQKISALAEHLGTLEDKDVQIIASVIGNIEVEDLQYAINNLDDETIEVIAKALGAGDVETLKTVIQNIPDEKVAKAIAQAFGYEDVNSLCDAIGNLNPKTVQAIAEALGLNDVEGLKTAISNMTGKTVKAIAEAIGKGAVEGLQDAIDGLKGKTVTVWAQIKQKASDLWSKFNIWGNKNNDEGGSGVNGTANVNGTTGRAYKQGSWGTKNSGTALVGELGTETLVRGGRYYTIGNNGAEFIKYKKGDIIFNHKQTEELFKYGRVTSGGGRAKALVSGTAFVNGSYPSSGAAFADATVGESNFAKNRQNKVVDADTDEAEDEFEELFDFIETAVSRIEREIDNLDTKANSTYRSWDERSQALAEQLGKVREEIVLQEQAMAKYAEAAAGVGLSDDWIKKIQEGSLDITTITDETLAEKISDYQKWFEKMLECEDAILELTETENDLIQQKFDNVITRYENLLSVVEHEKNMLDEYINQAEAQGHLVSENYYKALIANEKESISTLQAQKAELMTQMGNYEVGTQQWYENAQAIDDVTLAIEEANTAILEYEQTIEQLSWEVFDLIQDKISAVTEEADFLIELMSNKKLFEDDGQLTDEGMATVGLHGQNYNVYMHQADMAREEAERIKAQMAADEYDMELEEHYRELIALQQEYILAAEDEKNAIRDMVEEGIEYELDALQEKIDLYNEALESERDLYDYQKKVKEITEEIASLEKQRAAYDKDDSSEAMMRKQEIDVALENAKLELEETEYDKFIEDQQKLLDELYLEYETILNMRLDNIDLLMMQTIDEINANAGLISDTLHSTAAEVGTQLSTDMSAIWSENSASINGVIAMYSDKINFSQTTTYSAVSAIKTGVDNMVSQLRSIASQKATEAAASSYSANPTTATSTSSTSTNTTKKDTGTKSSSSSKNLTDDQLMGIAASIWVYGSGSGWGNDPVRSGKLTEKFDAATAKQVQSLINKYGESGDLYDFWVKKNYNLDKYKYSAFKSGARSINASQLAWTQEDGQEFIVRPSDGAILTPVAKGDSVLTSAASSNIWDMANSPAEFIKDNLNLGANVPNGSGAQNNYTQHIDNVVFRMDGVKNYDEMLAQMQKDKNFERLVLSMSIDRLAGKSNLAKGKSIR